MLSLNYFKNTFLFAFLGLLFGGFPVQGQILPGAQQTEQYLALLQNKKIGIVAHAASEIYASNSTTHFIDSLLALRVDVRKIFAPEHGFRIREDNGAIIKDEIDSLTQLPIISLHGKKQKTSTRTVSRSRSYLV